MDSISIFIAGILTVALITVFILSFLYTPMCKLLIDLTGTEDRAKFWTVFSMAELFLVPLVFALFYRPDVSGNTPVFFMICTQLQWALAGLVIAMAILGLVLNNSIARRGVCR